MTALILPGPDGMADVGELADALLASRLLPDRIALLDSPDGQAAASLSGHPLASRVEIVSLPPTAAPTWHAQAASGLTRIETQPGDPSDAVWLLPVSARPEPDALVHLVAALTAAGHVALAAPKLVDADDPGRLLSLGVATSSAGRLVEDTPAVDQGQYDSRQDVLAAAMPGALLDLAELRETTSYLGQLDGIVADLDFGWRLHRNGKRIVVVPRARVAVPPHCVGSVDNEARRAARQVALAHAAAWVRPWRAVSMAASSAALSLLFLLLKSPGDSRRELSGLFAVFQPRRTRGIRRAARTRGVTPRRHLGSMFVSPSAVAADVRDRLSALLPQLRSGDRAAPSPLGHRALPAALLVALVTVVMSLVASRHIGGSVIERLNAGVSGGELQPVWGGAGDLWRAATSGWSGPGFGGPGAGSPSLMVVSAAAAVIERLPGVSADSPAGVAIAIWLAACLPAAGLTAYLAGRVVSVRPLVRVVMALSWATMAAATTAVAQGRLGPTVAVVFAPLIAALVAHTIRGQHQVPAAAAAAGLTALVGAFLPSAIVVVSLVGVILVAVVRGARRAGALLAIGPWLLLGPQVTTWYSHPTLLMTGAGATAWNEVVPEPWQQALLHPGGAGSYPVLLTAPLVALALVGLVSSASIKVRLAGVVTVLVGLAWTLAAPRVVLARIPHGLPDAGQPVTAWTGIGMILSGLGLVALAGLGLELISARPRGRFSWLARWAIGAALVWVFTVAGYVAYGSWGDGLSTATDPRPAAAVAHASGPSATRVVLVDLDGESASYRVVGTEPAVLARDLPSEVQTSAPVTSAVAALVSGFAQGASNSAGDTPAAVLSSEAIGYLGIAGDLPDASERAVDAMSGLVRMPDAHGRRWWRVESPLGVNPPARVVVVRPDGAVALPSRDHARVEPQASATGDALLVAEVPAWADAAEVRINGSLVRPLPGEPLAYPIGSSPATVSISLPERDPWWRWLQLAAAAVVGFAALPVGPARREESA